MELFLESSQTPDLVIYMFYRETSFVGNKVKLTYIMYTTESQVCQLLMETTHMLVNQPDKPKQELKDKRTVKSFLELSILTLPGTQDF